MGVHIEVGSKRDDGLYLRHRALLTGRALSDSLRLRALAHGILQWTAWAALIYLAVVLYQTSSGGDAHAYWMADGYGVVDERDAFLYTPPFLLALQPFQILPWEVFRALFLGGQVIALAWMTGPVIAVLVLLPGPWSPVWTDLYFGNIMVFTAAITVAGFRHPAWWAVLPFGKVAPGVALLASRSWAPLGIASGVAVVTVLFFSDTWFEWWDAMQWSAASGHVLTGWLVPRLVVAATLAAMARRWRYALPAAVMLAQPVLWFSSLAILVGWVWILRDRQPVNTTERLNTSLEVVPSTDSA